MRKSSDISTVSPRSRMEELALQTQIATEHVEEIEQSSKPGEATITSPFSRERQSRLAAPLGTVEKRPKPEGTAESL